MSDFLHICIVGLGLIGGAMAKTIRQKTNARVYGFNRSAEVANRAKEEGVLDGVLGKDGKLEDMDLVILGLYPDNCIEFVKEHIGCFKEGAVIVDCCGTKQKICDALWEICHEKGVHFIGGHPMAGIEKSGYDASFVGLFDQASMILCKLSSAEDEIFPAVKAFFLGLGFGSIREATPEEHDRIIAYTSQMAHVVSSAYIKSEACRIRYGFSAGSFKDMTRVAYLNEHMWTELFMENRDSLLSEMEEFIGHMKEYHDALESRNEELLCKLLKEGRICKEEDIAKEEKVRKEIK